MKSINLVHQYFLIIFLSNTRNWINGERPCHMQLDMDDLYYSLLGIQIFSFFHESNKNQFALKNFVCSLYIALLPYSFNISKNSYVTNEKG